METDEAFLHVVSELMVMDVVHGNALAGVLFTDLVKQNTARLLAAVDATATSAGTSQEQPDTKTYMRAALSIYLHTTMQLANAPELIAHSPELRQGLVQLCANAPPEESATERLAKITALLSPQSGVTRHDALTVQRLLKELVEIYLQASRGSNPGLFENMNRLTTRAAQHQATVLAALSAATRDMSASPDPTQMLPPDTLPTAAFLAATGRRPSDAGQRRSAAATPARTPLEQSPAMPEPPLIEPIGAKRAIGTVVLQQPKLGQPSAERATTKLSALPPPLTTGRKVKVVPEPNLDTTPTHGPLNTSAETPAVPQRAAPSVPQPRAPSPQLPPVIRRYRLCATCGVYHLDELLTALGCPALVFGAAKPQEAAA